MRLGKRQAFICILMSLLMYGLAWYGLSPTITKPFGFALSGKIPLHDGESYPAPSPLWQDNQINIAFLQSVTVISSNKVLIKSPDNIRSASCYCHDNADSSLAQITLRIIDSPDTVFKFIDVQTYQYLDIPPPHASASL